MPFTLAAPEVIRVRIGILKNMDNAEVETEVETNVEVLHTPGSLTDSEIGIILKIRQYLEKSIQLTGIPSAL